MPRSLQESVRYLPFAKHDDYLTNDGHVCLFSKLLSGTNRRMVRRRVVVWAECYLMRILQEE
jgi:hypothetical protein